MNKEQRTIKNIIVLLTELAVVFLMIFGILPREAGLFLTGLLIFYFIFSRLEDSLWVFVASLPLFVALPIIESFDSMANWRVLLAVLFLVWANKSRAVLKKQPLRLLFKGCPLSVLTSIFLGIGALSLFVADDIWIGIKKLLFLINIFFLYIIIRNLANKDREIIPKLINAMKVAMGLVLAIGFVQFAAVFFVRLFPFWQFWARYIIPVFYGQSLSNLLSYSNTWFSYYTSLPATLRMFSVFPDSHSFAFFCILSLPFFLTFIFLRKKGSKIKAIFLYFFLLMCLLAIIFSGSRGTWVSALGVLFIFLFIVFLYWSPTVRSWTNFFIPRDTKQWWKQIQLILGCLVIFFLLFPISSRILLYSQQIQLERPIDLEGLSLFERAKSIIDFEEVSIKNRLEIWQRTINSIVIHPILGVGIGNYPKVLEEKMSSAKRGASAHCLYLDVASEMGIFALLVLLVIFWYIFRDAWTIFIKKRGSFYQVWAGFFILALIWILGYSLFDVVLLNDKVLLFFIVNLGLLYAAKSFISFNKSSYL